MGKTTPTMKKLLLSLFIVFGAMAVYGQYSPYGVTVAGGNGGGAAANQLNGPAGLYVDSAGNVYIADLNNARIQKWIQGTAVGITVAGGNGNGANDNQFHSPFGVWVDASHHIYVADNTNNRVQKWIEGDTIGARAVQYLNTPEDVFVDPNGILYVSSSFGCAVRKYLPGDTVGVIVAGGNGNGSAANQLANQQGIFVDTAGNIYISDRDNHRIQKWSPGATSGVTVAGGGGYGSAANQLNSPADVAVDVMGSIYIADYGNSRIQKWLPGASSGTTFIGGNGTGTGANQIHFPHGIFMDRWGYMYISDQGNNRVQKFFDKYPTIISPIDSVYGPTSAITINYIVSASFNLGNTFTLQLSDVSGDFSHPINLATITDTSAGSIHAFIPSNLPFGCNYQFRVIGSNPPVPSGPTSSFRIGTFSTPPQNYALQFNGTNASADLGTWFNQPRFTVSFWAKPDSIQTAGAGIADLQNDLSLYRDPSVQNNYILAHLMQQDLLPNKWQHVTITEDTGTRKMYVNGQLMQTNHWAYAPLANHHLVLGNGGVYTTAYWKGLIDEVKVYDHVLTDTEILAGVNKTLTGNEPGLLAYWNFDDEVCSGVSIDRTANARVGTLTNVQRVPSTIPNLGQQVIPNIGGNTGTVTVNIQGSFFEQGAGVKLSKAGSADIAATAVAVNGDGTNITCQFNLAGKDTGVYNVSVLNPDTTVKFYPNAFTIVTGTPPDVWVNITGSNVIRQQRDMTFLVSYGNNGTTDARGVPLWVAVSGDSTAVLKMNFTETGNPHYNATLAFDSIPKYYFADSFAGQHGKYLVAPLYIPVIAPNTSGVLSFTIRTNQDIRLQAIVGQPLYPDGLSPDMSNCIGMILAAHAHDILNNLVPNDSCFVTAFDSLCRVPGYTGTGSLLYNMAAAVRLCAGHYGAAGVQRSAGQWWRCTLRISATAQWRGYICTRDKQL